MIESNFPSAIYPKRLTFALIASQVFLFLSLANAGQVMPVEDWVDDYDLIASPDAVVGGKMTIAMGPYPSSFNMYTNYTVQAVTLFNQIFADLLAIDQMTLQWQPKLARKVEISDDQLSFTVHLDPDASWSDGKPITSADFLWTWNAILDPKNLAGVHRVSLEKFEDPVIIDEYTFKLVAKELHWRNLIVVASFTILPKHYFEDKEFNDVDFEFPVVSGLYKIVDNKEGVYLRVQRRDDWWLANAKRYQGIYNFETIEYRFFQSRDLTWEAFRKGEVDIFPMALSTIWNNDAKGKAFDNNWIVKQRVYNKEPIAFQGFPMNMREEPFNDVRVRKAMAHLLDRRRINETMLFSEYFMLNSFYADLYDDEHPNTNPQYEYEPDTARKLLAEAGWVANPETGILEKDGKPFVFTFLGRSPTFNKYLVIYKEALKDVGIEMNIEEKDWAAWTKDMDEFNFEMTLAAWGSSIFRDPEGMWGSKQADSKSSNNLTGYKNSKVDALIDKQRALFDVNDRNEVLREIDRLIQTDVPYVLIWMIDFTRMLYWNKFGTPDTVLDKYSDHEAANVYWWIDPDQEADLELAIENDEALPDKPDVIRWEELFQN